MPQISIGSANIISFGFSDTWDINNRSVLFDTSTLTSYQGSSGSGIFQVQGIAFSLIDQDGVELMVVDWGNPQIRPAINQQYTLDLSSLPYVFLFQNYKITGYIKDADGAIYSTPPIFKKICQPVNLTDSGYVPGIFQVIPDCVNNNITVKELTVLAYNNLLPESTTKSGTLSYPTGTISPVSFSGTPFTNNVIYTGEYRIACTTVGTYNLGDNTYVLVTFVTNNVFPVTCTSRIADLLCCVEGVQQTAIKHCNDAKGAEAKQKLNEISSYLLTGLLAEINGQDASIQADYIKKSLRCDCGASSIHQNEMTPINPSIYSIVLNGVGGTSIPSPTIVGGTKTFNIASNIYQITKKDSGDLAFIISTDTSIANSVKYAISFNYPVMAGYILTAFEQDPTYIARLQALIDTGLDLSGLDGNCILNTSNANYTLQLTGITSADLVGVITINGTNYNAPANLHANDAASVQTWLNTLAKGTFTTIFSAGVLTVSSVANTNTLSTITFLKGGISGTIYPVLFQSSKYTIVQILQAIIDYLCALTALQVALGNTLTLWQIDYNGNAISTSLTTANTQNDFNIGVANSIYNLVQRMNTLTGITCAKIAAIFQDYPNSSISASSRLYGSDSGNCVSWSDKQLALGVIHAIQSYSDVKTAFCAIDCGTPATCPDISDNNLGVSGANIGVYGVSWANTPTATQTVTVKYKLSSSGIWIVATNSLNILANGNISGTSPFLITGVVAGSTYDVQIINNCGGVGFSKQITMPIGSVYSFSAYRENSLYLICGATPATVYSNAPFASGITIYSNIGLTVPLTGYNYITVSGFNIFAINPSTGVVGADTGSACSSGTSGLYRLNNTALTTDTICLVPQQNLYTNGAFVVGGTLYRDVALTTPVTGYSYVLDIASGIIYNLNSVTGAIGSSTGLSCAGA